MADASDVPSAIEQVESQATSRSARVRDAQASREELAREPP